MKYQKLLAAAFTLLAFGAWAQIAPQLTQARGVQENAATLDDALKRLEKTLTRHGSRVVGGVIRRFDAKDFRGCKITYELTPQVAPDHKGFVPFIERIMVDLATLDPAQVVVREWEKGATVSFVTRDGERKIETYVASEPHQFGDASRFRSRYVYVTNKAAAEEARQALIRAIELCGR